MKIYTTKSYQKIKNYAGLNIETYPEVHEFVFNKFFSKANKNIKILMLGSGSGAFEARLFDNGFKNLYSTEYKKSTIKFENTKKYEIDLNKKFAEIIKEKFDVIVSIEIIEHLDSRKNFLKNCYELLNTNGKLIITTPNVQSFLSRLVFLFRGYPLSFEPEPEKLGHTVPILEKYFVFDAKDIGLKKIKSDSCCSYLNNIIVYGFSSFIKWCILLPIFLIAKMIDKTKMDAIKVFYLEK